MTRLQILQKLQNRAARIDTRSNFDSSAKPLIHNLKWPIISDIISSETATIMYKTLNGLAPEYLSKRFVKISTRNIRQLRNTETDLLFPLRRTSNGQKGISFHGSKLWNQLDYDLNKAPSLAMLKRTLKEHLLLYSVTIFFILFLIVCHGPLKSSPLGLTGLQCLKK